MLVKYIKTPRKEISSNRLMCCVVSIEFESDTCVILNLSEMHCTDMRGAIKFSKYILPKVKCIKCYNDYDYIEYRLLANRTWIAFRSEQRH